MRFAFYFWKWVFFQTGEIEEPWRNVFHWKRTEFAPCHQFVCRKRTFGYGADPFILSIIRFIQFLLRVHGRAIRHPAIPKGGRR